MVESDTWTPKKWTKFIWTKLILNEVKSGLKIMGRKSLAQIIAWEQINEVCGGKEFGQKPFGLKRIGPSWLQTKIFCTKSIWPNVVCDIILLAKFMLDKNVLDKSILDKIILDEVLFSQINECTGDAFYRQNSCVLTLKKLVMTSFDYAITQTRGNWFKSNPPVSVYQ